MAQLGKGTVFSTLRKARVQWVITQFDVRQGELDSLGIVPLPLCTFSGRQM